jgi:transketolase C-terminal domain/subunit
VEEHSNFGGLSAAVAEAADHNNPTLKCIIGLDNTFCENGTPEALFGKYGLGGDHKAEQTKGFVKELD